MAIPLTRRRSPLAHLPAPARTRRPIRGRRWADCNAPPARIRLRRRRRWADCSATRCPPRRSGEWPARRVGYGRSKSRPVPVRLRWRPGRLLVFVLFVPSLVPRTIWEAAPRAVGPPSAAGRRLWPPRSRGSRYRCPPLLVCMCAASVQNLFRARARACRCLRAPPVSEYGQEAPEEGRPRGAAR